MTHTNDMSTPNRRSGSALGALSIYLKGRASVAEAVATIMVDPAYPKLAAVLESYRKFAEFHGAVEPGQVLDNFMVQVGDLLKQRGTPVDALTLYTLRFKMALALAIRD